MKGNQFICWREVPNPDPTKKPIKKPVNSVTGKGIDAHDPRHWMSREQAEATAALYGDHIAFVLTANDPYFCVDLDDVNEGGKWSQFANDVLSMFPGAFVELSFNGNGLHIWGRAADPGEHRNRAPKDVPGLEVYTKARFIALGTQGTGDPETDHTAGLTALLARYLPGQNANNPANWTNHPAAEWSGPSDDDELIDRMLKATPGMSLMTGKASFADLWTGNVDAITASYPSVTEGEPFDHSAADAALCAHLAWWTGKNCERIDALFRRSALYRDKWEKRADYRANTVTGACAKLTGVYKASDAKAAPPTASAPGNVPDGAVRNGSTWMNPAEQIVHFKGCVYVLDDHKVMIPGGMLLQQGQFNAFYGGFNFARQFGEGRPAKHAWEAFTESQVITFPKVERTCFRPELTPGTIITEDGVTMVNTFAPVPVPRMTGDVTPFLDLITRLFPDPNDRAVILAYCAAVVQFPGVKFQWCPLIQGAEGNGKTFIATAISKAIGRRYSHTPRADDVANKFNDWLEGKIFAVIEEVYTKDKWEVTENMKPLITNRHIEIQPKGGAKRPGYNCCNFIMCSNHRDAVAKTRNDRRYAVFFTPQQSFEDIQRDGMGGDYFPRLYGWLNGEGGAIVTDFLLRYEIPDALNPATSCHRAPATTSTEAAISESYGVIEQEILEAVEEGRTGFRGGFISSWALTTLLEEKRLRVGPRKRGDIIRNLGYEVHPALGNGRVRIGLEEEMVEAKIYTKPGVSVGVSREKLKVDYRAAQGYASSGLGDQRVVEFPQKTP